MAFIDAFADVGNVVGAGANAFGQGVLQNAMLGFKARTIADESRSRKEVMDFNRDKFAAQKRQFQEQLQTEKQGNQIKFLNSKYIPDDVKLRQYNIWAKEFDLPEIEKWDSNASEMARSYQELHKQYEAGIIDREGFHQGIVVSAIKYQATAGQTQAALAGAGFTLHKGQKAPDQFTVNESNRMWSSLEKKSGGNIDRSYLPKGVTVEDVEGDYKNNLQTMEETDALNATLKKLMSIVTQGPPSAPATSGDRAQDLINDLGFGTPQGAIGATPPVQ